MKPLRRPPYCYFIADSSYGRARLSPLVAAVLKGGIRIVQLRCKNVAGGEWEELAYQLKNMVKDYRGIFLINDAARLCHRVGADGVHLGWQDMSPQEARLLLGKEAVIGLTIHNANQAQTADYDRIDYVSIGPVFRSETKRQKNYLGIDKLRALMTIVQQHSSLPVFCIGGINRGNISRLNGLGVTGVVVCAGIASMPDPTIACRQLRDEMRLLQRG